MASPPFVFPALARLAATCIKGAVGAKVGQSRNGNGSHRF